MNYLVTGGAGFIGSSLVNYLLELGNKVVVIDDLSMGKKENLNFCDNLEFIEGCITDEYLMSGILKASKFDYIFHLAAIASVADSVDRPVETHRINYDSLLLLLELVKKNQPDLKRLVFASSASVYGNKTQTEKYETDSVCPMTQYAVDKYAAERTVLNAQHLYGVKTSAVRFFNVYGPNQNPSSPYSGVISILVDTFLKQMNGDQTVFKVFGDGEQTRDFVYIEDVINALMLVASSTDSLGEVYNVGTGKETSLNQVIMQLSTIFEYTLSVNYLDKREGDIDRSVANIDKLKSLNFEVEYSIYSGLKKFVRNVKSFNERL